MADLSVQYPSTYGGSDLYNALDFQGWNMRNTQMQQALQDAQINRAQSLQDLYKKQQMLPIDLRKGNLEADTTEAQLPGIQAESWQKADKARQLVLLDQMFPGLRTQGAGAKLKADQFKDQLEGETAGIGLAMVDPSPSVRQVAQEQFMRLPQQQQEILKMNLAGQNAATVAQITQAGMTQREREATAAGKYLKKWNISNSLKLDMESDPVKKLAMLQDFAEQARQAGDADSYEHYLTRAQQMATLAQAKLAASQPKPGTVDISGVTNGAVPAQPGMPVMPPQPQVSAPTQFKSPDDVKAAYKAGKLSKDAAVKILREQYGMK